MALNSIYFNFLVSSKNCECWRSRSKSPSRSDWHYVNNAVDAIEFQTNGDVILSGYRLWGVSSGSTTFQVTIRLYRDGSLIAEKTGSYYTSSSVKTFEVHFSQRIAIRAGVSYTATAQKTTSARSFALTDGMASTSCSGLTVNFKDSSKDSNGSRQSQGQIPALIFRSSQCWKGNRLVEKEGRDLLKWLIFMFFFLSLHPSRKSVSFITNIRCGCTSRSTARGCWPRGSFPKVKLPRGNSHGYVKKNKQWTVPEVYSSTGLMRTQSGSTNHEKDVPNSRNHLLSRSCMHVFILWPQKVAKMDSKFENTTEIRGSSVFKKNFFDPSGLSLV